MKKYEQKESEAPKVEEPAVAYSVLNAEMSTRQKAIEAFNRMREAAAATGVEMTLEEINAEIKAARDERRKRNQ